MNTDKNQGKLIVIVGPSGVGKGTVLEQVFKQSQNLVYSVSATTRSPREGEVDGINYFFKTREEFQKMIKDGELLEWAEFVGNYYGTPSQYIKDQITNGQNVILEIELEGAKQIKKQMPNSLFVFIAPPSIEVLQQRLEKRNTETPEKIQSRIEKAKGEIDFAENADFFDQYLVNGEGQIDNTVQSLLKIL